MKSSSPAPPSSRFFFFFSACSAIIGERNLSHSSIEASYCFSRPVAHLTAFAAMPGSRSSAWTPATSDVAFPSSCFSFSAVVPAVPVAARVTTALLYRRSLSSTAPPFAAASAARRVAATSAAASAARTGANASTRRGERTWTTAVFFARRHCSPNGAKVMFFEPYDSLCAAATSGREAKARSWFLYRGARKNPSPKTSES
uniref:Uncharacterized protein n=1 Tax=Oryza meridionalis TaxID=40149 RepID=A0A0E0EU46_9ORYZ